MNGRLFKRYGSPPGQWEYLPALPAHEPLPADDRLKGDQFNLSQAQFKALQACKSFKRDKPKKAPVFEIKLVPGVGWQLVKAVVLSRKHVRNFHAFECLNLECGQEFRLKGGTQGTCPFCGSLYCEWLSFKVAPQDVFLGCEEEWAALPASRLTIRKKTSPA